MRSTFYSRLNFLLLILATANYSLWLERGFFQAHDEDGIDEDKNHYDLTNLALYHMMDDYFTMLSRYNSMPKNLESIENDDYDDEDTDIQSDNGDAENRNSNENNDNQSFLMRDIMARSKLKPEDIIQILSKIGNRERIFDLFSSLCRIDIRRGVKRLKSNKSEIADDGDNFNNAEGTDDIREKDLIVKVWSELGNVKFEMIMEYLFGRVITRDEFRMNVEHRRHFAELHAIIPYVLNEHKTREAEKARALNRNDDHHFLSDRIRLFRQNMQSNIRNYALDPLYPEDSCITDASEFYSSRKQYKILTQMNRGKPMNPTSPYHYAVTLSKPQLHSNSIKITKYLSQIIANCTLVASSSSSYYPPHHHYRNTIESIRAPRDYYEMVKMVFQQLNDSETDLMGRRSSSKFLSRSSEALDMAQICSSALDPTQKEIEGSELPEGLVETCKKIHRLLTTNERYSRIAQDFITIDFLFDLIKDYDQFFDLNGLLQRSIEKSESQCTRHWPGVSDKNELNRDSGNNDRQRLKEEFPFLDIVRLYNENNTAAMRKKKDFDLFGFGETLTEGPNKGKKVSRKCLVHVAIEHYEDLAQKMRDFMTQADAIDYSKIHEDSSDSNTGDQAQTRNHIVLDKDGVRKQMLFMLLVSQEGLDDFEYHHNVIAAIYGRFAEEKMLHVRPRSVAKEEAHESLCDIYDINLMRKVAELIYDYKYDEVNKLDVDEEFRKAVERYRILPKPEGKDKKKQIQRFSRAFDEILYVLLESDSQSRSLHDDLKDIEIEKRRIDALHSSIFDSTVPSSFFDTDEAYPMQDCAYGPRKRSIVCEASINTRNVAKTLLRINEKLKKDPSFRTKLRKLSFVNLPLVTLPDFFKKWRIEEMVLNGVFIDPNTLEILDVTSKLTLKNILSEPLTLPHRVRASSVQQRLCLDHHYSLESCLTAPEALHRTVLVRFYQVDTKRDAGYRSDYISPTKSKMRREGVKYEANFFQKPISMQFAMKIAALSVLTTQNVYLDYTTDDELVRNVLEKLLLLDTEEYSVISHLDSFCSTKIRVKMGPRQVMSMRSCFCTEKDKDSFDSDDADTEEELGKYLEQTKRMIMSQVKTFIKFLIFLVAFFVLMVSMMFENPQLPADAAIIDKGSMFGNRAEYAALKYAYLQYKSFFDSQNIEDNEIEEFEKKYQQSAYNDTLRKQKIRSILEATGKKMEEDRENEDDDSDN